MLRYMQFRWDCGRGGILQGRFVVSQTEYDRLMGAVGRDIYFGEVLGKHSEVFGVLEGKDLKVITENQGWLEKAAQLGIDLDTGFNPLDYMEDEVFEDEEEDPED